MKLQKISVSVLQMLQIIPVDIICAPAVQRLSALLKKI